MAIDAINSFNPFLAQAQGVQPKIGGQQTPAINPFSPQAPKVGGQGQGELGSFQEAIKGFNFNPQLSFLRGEAMTNMPLGEAEAINVKGGKAGAALNVIS